MHLHRRVASGAFELKLGRPLGDLSRTTAAKFQLRPASRQVPWTPPLTTEIGLPRGQGKREKGSGKVHLVKGERAS